MTKRKLTNKFKLPNITFAIILGVFLGATACNQLQILKHKDPVLPPNQEQILLPNPAPQEENNNIISSQNNRISTCFTPPPGCSKVIIKTINNANESIYVQAYGFTDVRIADSLIAAHERGVKVSILLDKSNLYSKHSQMTRVKEAGIEVYIDRVPGIAHNKVMIIDNHTVITGSFNFSKNADLKNAENVIIINDLGVAKQYYQNWLSRKQKSSKAI